ncbi:MAG: hypothetical protein ACO1ON_13050 [Nocardioides sp.]
MSAIDRREQHEEDLRDHATAYPDEQWAQDLLRAGRAEIGRFVDQATVSDAYRDLRAVDLRRWGHAPEVSQAVTRARRALSDLVEALMVDERVSR